MKASGIKSQIKYCEYLCIECILKLNMSFLIPIKLEPLITYEILEQIFNCEGVVNSRKC